MAKRYTETHEWIEECHGLGTVGMTSYAQKELGDIVYIELPKIGAKLMRGQEACVIESTKAAVDVYAPCSGTVVAVNDKVIDAEAINTLSENEGWLFKIQLDQPEEVETLMEEESYLAKIKQLISQ